MSYTAPVKDMLFDMQHLANIEQIAQIPSFEDAGFDTAQAVLEECAKFNEGVLAPLNWEGDKNPSSWKDGVVTTTPGFRQAFAEFGAGALMVAGVFTWLSAPVALVIGGIGAGSVIKAVYIDKRELKCACVGGDSNVPLGFLSLTENLMMIAMAVWMLAVEAGGASAAGMVM